MPVKRGALYTPGGRRARVGATEHAFEAAWVIYCLVTTYAYRPVGAQPRILHKLLSPNLAVFIPKTLVPRNIRVTKL